MKATSLAIALLFLRPGMATAATDEVWWGHAELVADVTLDGFYASGFAALDPETFVISDGNDAMTIYRVSDSKATLLTTAADCDELLYRTVFGRTDPTLLLTTGNRVAELNSTTGDYAICTVGSNVQCLAVTAPSSVTFENRGAPEGQTGELSECGPYSLSGTGLPDWADFTGCSPTYLPVDDGVWLCTYREGDTCVTSLFAQDGELITPAVATTHPMPESSGGNYIQPIPNPSGAANMHYGMVVDTTIVGFRLDGTSALLATGFEYIDGIPGRIVFDPAPEVPGYAFVMRSISGIIRIYRVNSIGPDCDDNGISDADEIAAGAADLNGNGIPDTCECIADLTGNGEVNGADISVLLGFWGKVPEPLPAADINQDGVVNGLDLGVLLGNWGPCQ